MISEEGFSGIEGIEGIFIGRPRLRAVKSEGHGWPVKTSCLLCSNLVGGRASKESTKSTKIAASERAEAMEIELLPMLRASLIRKEPSRS